MKLVCLLLLLFSSAFAVDTILLKNNSEYNTYIILNYDTYKFSNNTSTLSYYNTEYHVHIPHNESKKIVILPIAKNNMIVMCITKANRLSSKYEQKQFIVNLNIMLNQPKYVYINKKIGKLKLYKNNVISFNLYKNDMDIDTEFDPSLFAQS